MTCTQESGTCRECVSYCHRKPGWFLPGEAEKAAELMDLPLPEFFRRYLAVDWWVGHPDADYEDVFVLSPAVVGGLTGEEFDGDPRGRCVFLTAEDRCQIHDAKPHECRVAWCGGEPGTEHRDVATAWISHQAQITGLLGREPVATDFNGGGLLGGLFG